jgi:hypothetical protein
MMSFFDCDARWSLIILIIHRPAICCSAAATQTLERHTQPRN